MGLKRWPYSSKRKTKKHKQLFNNFTTSFIDKKIKTQKIEYPKILDYKEEQDMIQGFDDFLLRFMEDIEKEKFKKMKIDFDNEVLNKKLSNSIPFIYPDY